IKKQALEKLILDEVLLQHVQNENLVVTDETARAFIKTLDYFQTDGKFNNKQYKSLLASQRMSAVEFVNKIKKALVMEQFQRSVIESGFTTQKDVDNFFRIQNQKRDVEVISIALQKIEEQPLDEEIESYYQQNQQAYLTEEQVAIEYVDLSLDELAKQVEPSVEQLKDYYEEQKDLYTTKERRKISHILFAFTKDAEEDEKQLERALKAKQELEEKEFSVLASELSDDKLTAAKGGDLGLFNVGVMEKAFEDAAGSLKLGEVSEPVKSAFGYHLIKVTELVASEIKVFDTVKDEITKAYQRSEAENTFYELGETLTEVSYENPDSLQTVADAIGLEIKKTGLFGKNVASNTADEGGIVSQAAIVNVAFSEDVLKGNNSEPVELGTDRLVVLRMLEYTPAEIKALKDVKTVIVEKLLNNKAKLATTEKAEKIKSAVVAGKSMQEVADENSLKVQKFSDLTRANGELAWQVNQAVFKAAKPVDGKSTVVTVADSTGSQTVINLLSVTEGVMSESDTARQKLAESNMA
ncbi:MAG: peptidylprolyl isomerase, partial [Methylococcales bacterium]|nr:peptidylprolyl isomerase [Methylococcales bacterium]